METFREFGKDPEHKNWLKGVVALSHVQKHLECFIDEESETFHSQLRNNCGPGRCEKKCNLKNWKPEANGPNQV